MVKLAVAGGSGNVASEIITGILAAKKHQVTILTRKEFTALEPGLQYKKVDYNDKASLISALEGIDVVFSFMVVHLDEGCIAQKNLIHACIDAGVKRFAPSEWGVKNNNGIYLYKHKDDIAEYLKEINRDKQVLEYTLFQPSLFLDYFAHPYPLSKTLYTWPFFIDYENKRAIVLDDGNQPIALTRISDISNIVALALDDPNPWPPVGGMRGTSTTINQLIALGEEIRGEKFQLEYVKGEDIEKGELKTSWVPAMTHPIIPLESREKFSKEFIVMFMVGILRGAWNTSDEWNKRYPDYKFTSAEEYLIEAWKGKS
ncbi:NmrA-like family protein-like protein [Zopfia rhizophila CBS 207.26]|uniref:NmrA-like family protein-like protein n=1 Tax=Zopfia rhizophila CBS 207.26 TaxID=1314779 RepID=A0A6A6DUJ0_9PEZI|nr:NmrA-like family protein-like protein [Zopfia rhizophila CBS 207.26]